MKIKYITARHQAASLQVKKIMGGPLLHLQSIKILSMCVYIHKYIYVKSEEIYFEKQEMYIIMHVTMANL